MKTVLITGCSSGFGFELVTRYLKLHWRVYATMRNAKERASIFTAETKDFPTTFHLLELDVTKREDRDRMVGILEAGKINLDVVVNNAGYGLFGAFEDVSEEQIREQMEVNVFGLMLLTQQLLPLLRKSRGRIFNLSSAVGYLGLPISSMYCTSKFAVEGFTESLFYELQPFGVQVCLIEPGRHRTGFSKKLTYGERSFDPFSPYFAATKRFKELRDQHSSGPGVPSYHVVEKIIDLSEAKKIPLRVQVGTDAKTGYYLKKFLPSGIFSWLFARVFTKALFEKRPIELEN